MSKLKKKKMSHRINVRSEQKNDQKSKFIVIFLGILMIGSTFGVIFFGYSSDSSQGAVTYNGKMFEITPQGYKHAFKGKEFYFRFLPQDVLEEQSQIKSAIQDVVVLSFKPTHVAIQSIDAARLNLAQLSSLQQKPYGEAVMVSSSIYPLTVLTCANATFSSPLVVLDDIPLGSMQNKTVSFEQGCFYIKASSIDTEKYLDAIQYTMMEII